jgi:hypothetical protein
MRRWMAVVILLALAACRPIGADVVTPTPVPAATSYVAPLRTVPPTTEATAVPTPQPEDLTDVPSIITVEPAVDMTAAATATP